MGLIRMMNAMLRDREALYERLEQRRGLPGLCLKFLVLFVVTAGVYGAAMGSYRCFHPSFFFSTFRLEIPGRPPVTGDVAGMRREDHSVFADTSIPGTLLAAGDGQDGAARTAALGPGPALPEGSIIRFNVSNPSEPYRVVALSEEKGYARIQLAADAPLAEASAWRMPVLVALKMPLLFILALLVCAPALYVLNLAFGLRLDFMPTMTPILFALAASGVMLAVFVPIVGLFAVVTESYHFVKVMHVLVVAIAGLFGLRVLWASLRRLAPDKSFRASALLMAWLLLYCVVGAQLAWNLKPWLGTPYLANTPPFRLSRGNIYVSVCRSVVHVFTR